MSIAPAARVRLQPCLRFEAGALAASGVNAQPSRSETRAWAEIGAVLRGRVDVVKPLFVEAEGLLDAPLTRDRFFLEPDTTVFRSAAVGWGASAGIGVSLW